MKLRFPGPDRFFAPARPRLDRRTLFNIALICAPAAAGVVLSAVFIAYAAPRIENDAGARARAESEEVAAKLRADRGRAAFSWQKGVGVVSGSPSRREYPKDMAWKDWNPVSHKRGTAWGWLDTPRGRDVWIRGDGADYQRAYVAETDISTGCDALIFSSFTAAMAALLAFLSFLGVARTLAGLKMRDDFLAAAAHDLASPLVAMRFAIASDPQAALKLDERLLRIVGNIKDFLKLGGRRPPPAKEPFDFAKAYEEAYSVFAEEFRDVLGEGGVPVETPPEGLPPALGDETLAVQAVWNILANALKYAAPYGPVKAAFSSSGGFVRLEIADRGPGISGRDAARVFDRYWRAGTALRTGRGGFGIGLCSAKEAVVSMGGSLELRPNPGGGSIFAISLPAAPRHAPLV